MAQRDGLFEIAFASFLVFAGCGGSEAEERCGGDATSAPDPDTEIPTTGPDPTTSPGDVDQDGFTVEDGDCDDFNNTRYPGAPETGWDGADSDCDGEDGPLVDAEHPGERSFAEFEALCASSARLDGSAPAGVVQMHAACSASNACRGMSYGNWGPDAVLTEHGCRAMNWCNGWSCVEAAEDQQRDPVTLYETHCAYCHGWQGPLDTVDGSGNPVQVSQFTIMVRPGTDPAAAQAEFPTRPDTRFRAAIAFGLTGATSSGQAYANMPSFHKTLSRAEIDGVIGYVRSMPLTTYVFEYPDGSTIP